MIAVAHSVSKSFSLVAQKPERFLQHIKLMSRFVRHQYSVVCEFSYAVSVCLHFRRKYLHVAESCDDKRTRHIISALTPAKKRAAR